MPPTGAVGMTPATTTTSAAPLGAGMPLTSTASSAFPATRSVAPGEVVRETIAVPEGAPVSVTTTVQPALRAAGEVYGSAPFEVSHMLPVESNLSLLTSALPVEGSIPLK